MTGFIRHNSRQTGMLAALAA